MTKSKTARAYLDGFGTVRSILDVDDLTAEEILEALFAESDPHPGRRADQRRSQGPLILI